VAFGSARSVLSLGPQSDKELLVKTLFSTDQVHARDRFDFWHAVACNNLVDHDSRPECRQTFHAKMQTGDLADVGLVLFENAPMGISHTTHHTGRMQADELFICRQEAGDVTLLDPRLPYFGKFSSNSSLLVLKVLRRDLEARLGNPREMTCHAIKGSQPENGLVSAFLDTLPAHAGNLGAAAKDIVKNQALDLFSVSWAQTMEGSKPRVSSARSLALLSLRAAIDARLADPWSGREDCGCGRRRQRALRQRRAC
jgi:AraC family transcriptional regulator, positive regulator of tynA and feaB